MKKFLFAIMITLVLPIHWQKEASKPDHQGNHTKEAEKPNTVAPAVPVIAPVNQKTTDTQVNRTVDEPKGYFKRLFGPENLTNIGLLYAGVVGIIVGIGTLFVFIAQTKATKRAADAAYLNAQAVINAERPWLLIPVAEEFSEIKDPILPDAGDMRVASVSFNLKNFGKSPARIIEQKIGLFIGEDSESVPNTYAYDSRGSLQEDYTFPQGAVIRTEATLEPGGYISLQGRAEVLASRRFLWLCGYCKYRAASDLGEGLVYESRFCYLWINNSTRPKPFWIMRGPREYNRAT
jgi:hypothetical protein